MSTRTLFHAALFVLFQIASAFVIFTALVMAGFGLRDGFCYPGYIANLTTAIIGVGLVAGVALIPGAALAAWSLGEMNRLWSYVMMPHWLTFLSLAALYGADVIMRLVNDAHCARGLPEVQDNTAKISVFSEVLTYLAAASAFGALLACIFVVMKMLTVANRPDAA